jgi:hypothetical protein
VEGGFSWLGLLSGTAIAGLADRRNFHRREAPSPGFLSPVSLKTATLAIPVGPIAGISPLPGFYIAGSPHRQNGSIAGFSYRRPEKLAMISGAISDIRWPLVYFKRHAAEHAAASRPFKGPKSTVGLRSISFVLLEHALSFHCPPPRPLRVICSCALFARAHGPGRGAWSATLEHNGPTDAAAPPFIGAPDACLSSLQQLRRCHHQPRRRCRPRPRRRADWGA